MLEFYIFRKDECSVQQCKEAINRQEIIGASWQQELLQIYLHTKSFSKVLDIQMISKLQKRQEAKIDKYIQTILLLAGVAPLLGLLGTVGGMITTFEAISEFGTGNARAMSAGISEALITTQTGLLVAVPGLVLGSFLRRRADNIKSRMHRFGLGLIRVMG